MGGIFLFPLLFLFLSPRPAAAQQEIDAQVFRDLVQRVEQGETEEVRLQLPELIRKYQTHPGVLYLQARLASDGIESAKLYGSILDNFPRSEWADDALYNLQQYYYAMGLYKTAELKMQQLRKEYPESEYLSGKKPPLPEVDSGAAAPAETFTGGAADSAGLPGGDMPPPPPRDLPDTAGTTPADTVPAAPPAQPDRPYTLQTGAFSTVENASTQKSFFEQRGYTVEVTNRVRGGRSLHLVWVGSYATAEEARAALREIQDRYSITPIIVER